MTSAMFPRIAPGVRDERDGVIAATGEEGEPGRQPSSDSVLLGAL